MLFEAANSIDSDKFSIGVVIEDGALRDLFACDAGSLREVDVQRNSIRMVVELYGLNPRSGNALSTATLSSNVTTLKSPLTGIADRDI